MIKKLFEWLKINIPGLLLLLAITLFTTYISRFLPKYIGKVIIVILIGIVIANITPIEKSIFIKGAKKFSKILLKVAIVLLGAGISFAQITRLGMASLGVIILLIVFIFIVTTIIGKKLNISLRRILLISVGASICGNSAIAAVSPLINAEEEETSMAVSIVTLFGIIGVLLYPYIGNLLGMSDIVFGSWAGTAINNTSQAVAGGFLYSDAAGEIATTVKLVRNIMILPVVFIVSFYYNKKTAEKTAKINVLKLFPVFILGFFAMTVLNSIGIIGPKLSGTLVDISKFMILLALSGIGLSVNFKKFLKLGLKPFLFGFAVEFILAIASLGLNYLVFEVFKI